MGPPVSPVKSCGCRKYSTGHPLSLPGPSQDKGPAAYQHQSQIHYQRVYQVLLNLVQTQIQDSFRSQQQHDRHNAIIASLQTLRSNPTVSDSVNNLPTSYKVQTHSDLAQGKPNPSKCSGRYNTHDIDQGQTPFKIDQ